MESSDPSYEIERCPSMKSNGLKPVLGLRREEVLKDHALQGDNGPSRDFGPS